MDTREARFLASQAARLADNKRQQKSRRRNQQSIVDNNDGIDLPDGDNKNSRDYDTPTNNLIDAENIIVNTSDHNHNSSRDHKEEGHKFWSNFRKLCSELQCQIDSLLLVTSSDDGEHNNNSNSNDGDSKKYETVKAYYAIASRRTEGRNLLDSILDNVRLLRKHCLSSSSSMMLLPVTNNNDNNSNNNNNDKSNHCHPTNNNQLLQSILQTPMPEMTSQSDLRLLSDEIDRLLKHIDDVREIISPKEKFIFRRYRLAMEERGRNNIMLGNANAVGVEGTVEEVVDGTNNACLNKMDKEQTTAGETGTTTTSNDHHYDGGLLENKNDCIIEIYSDGTIKEWSKHELTKEQQQYIQYYGGPRRLNGLHPPTFNNNAAAAAATTTTETTTVGGNNNSIIMSYLLQNLNNVTILLHGSRPSLHIKNIQSCQIYVTEPTCGPVHVTNCYSSVVRCSCYQLRIHDSSDVKFSVWVRSGPIIENCTKIVFDGSYYCLEMDESSGGEGENMYWDVKDFNWLRTLRKSPNYTVVTGNDHCDDDDGKDDSKGEHTVEANIVEMAPSREEEEGDSEDEL
ncbi:hypothetical protein ACHAWC_009524 [Mediolabrus comicus]